MIKLVTVESKHESSDYCDRRIEVVFGNTFFEKRTAGCEYHFDESLNKQQRLISYEDKIDYKILTLRIKNAVSTQ